MSYDYDAIAGSLRAAGIRHAFGVTGSGASLALIRALEGREIGYHPVIHESAAALMAGAVSHDGHTRGLAVTIKGPGFANLFPGLLSNAYEYRPSLSISEAYAPGANPWQAHKRLDHEEVAGNILKACTRMDPAGACIGGTASLARQESPGPVHIDLSPVPAEIDTGTHTGNTGTGSVDDALRRIRQSSRPLVVLGSWALRRLGHLHWNRLRIPLVTTAAGKGCVDERGPWAGGVITGEAGTLAPESSLIPGADLVVAFGLRNREVVRAAPYHCPLLCIDAMPMADPGGFRPDLECISPDEAGLAELIDALGAFEWGRDDIATWRDRISESVLSDRAQLGHTLRRIEENLGGRGLFPRLVPDTGFFCTIAETVWRCREPGDIVGSAVGRFMGVSLPTAIGLAISSRDRPVVCIAGDGGIGGAFSELRLAVEEKLPLLVVHVSDGGYGSVAAFSEPVPAVKRATGFPGGKWWKMAAGLGLDSARLTDMSAIDGALAGWEPANGPLFLQLEFAQGPYRDIPRSLRG